LGEKIGAGATADVHAWAPGQVVKLFKPGFSRRLARHEVHMTHTAFTAGAPAPQVFGMVTLEGRFGMVLEHLDGPTLLQLTRTGAMAREEAGAILAGLFRAVHDTPPPPDVLLLSEWMEVFLASSNGALPDHIAGGVLALIDRLPSGDRLCHVDPHPGNVIMTAKGPKFVDWTFSMRAPAALDLGCCHMMLSEFAPLVADDPERPRAVNAAMQAEYARLAGTTPAALAAAIELYMPVVCVFYLLVNSVPPALQERVIRRVEAAL
jgi:tRNA A-37 threonylcarbamoyl transferase component Bud32